MNAAVFSVGLAIVAALAAAVGLFALDEPVAGWLTLVIGLFCLLSLVAMIASTGRAQAQQQQPLPPPTR